MIEPKIKYGNFTEDASVANATALACGSILSKMACGTPSVKIIFAPIMGATVAASPLNDCAKFKRCTAVFGSPNSEA